MHRYNLGKQLLKARRSPASRNVVRATMCSIKLTQRLLCQSCAAGVCAGLKSQPCSNSQHFVNRQVGMRASFAQRSCPAAAVIDAELLKSPGRIGNFNG